MKVAILGYGKEGKANEAYFQGREITIVDPYRDEDYKKDDFSQYDLVLRSPSVRPRPGFSSGTEYFFEHCPVPIIGVTGTKGKGTTCSMIRDLLESLGRKVWLVGNIGVPAISKLDEIIETTKKSGHENSCVVYEMSSFQLWDLRKSPQTAVILGIAPDHLNVHRDFEEYVAAKGRITEFQTPGDRVVYFRENQWSRMIAERSPGKRFPFPVEGNREKLDELLDNLRVPGAHNREDAEAAILAVVAFLGVSLKMLINQHFQELAEALANFQGLPHHIEFVRELNGVSYYDDSFSTAKPALEVALRAFPGQPLVLIAGGQDKGVDLSEVKKLIFGTKELKKVFLLGEIAEKLAEGEEKGKFEIVKDLTEAVQGSQKVAEKYDNSVVLLSPGAASLDMFKSYYERGEEFQRLVRNLR